MICNPSPREIFFLQNPWIAELKSPKILVIGAHNWLAHYILHILSSHLGMGKIIAVDTEFPAYLQEARYKEIQQIKLKSKFLDLKNLILDFSPHLVFHADYCWESYEASHQKIYESNVCKTEMICSACQEAKVKRVILFSSARVYKSQQKLLDEEAQLHCKTPISKSFRHIEENREIV